MPDPLKSAAATRYRTSPTTQVAIVELSPGSFEAQIQVLVPERPGQMHEHWSGGNWCPLDASTWDEARALFGVV
ncbi:MAG TPA: hypothetical protein VLC09_03775 [Polyangiaceae bacterium]|nr:hypothetical protein [Polyangiaceae bacterium]